MPLFLNIPTTARELSRPELNELNDRRRELALAPVAYNPLMVRRENLNFIAGSGSGIATPGPQLIYRQNYQGDLPLKYLPVIQRPDPYTTGFRR